jgi:hypothetical protein
MIYQDAFYTFILNAWIVVGTAYFLDLWARHNENSHKKEEKTKTDKK